MEDIGDYVVEDMKPVLLPAHDDDLEKDDHVPARFWRKKKKCPKVKKEKKQVCVVGRKLEI